MANLACDMNSVFSSYDDCRRFLVEYQRETSTNYIKQYNDKTFNCDIKDWQTICKQLRFHTDNIPFLGYPFRVVGHQCLACHQGISQAKKKQPDDVTNGDHNFALNTKKRRRIARSKKVGCTAKVTITQLFTFPDFTVDKDATRHKRQTESQRLREAIDRNPNEIRVVPKFHVVMPKLEDHTGHPTSGPIAGRRERIDPAVTSFLIREAKSGVRKVSVAKRHLQSFVEQDFPDLKHDRTRRSFFPSDHDIRNRLYQAQMAANSRPDDQKNLAKLVRSWKKRPDVHIRFRPSTLNKKGEKQDSLLFVYQCDWQRHLLLRYGGIMCLLDATYKTCEYSLPLFFLCVRTNFQYVAVAAFVTADETQASIEEALSVVKAWNPTWRPEHFMTDKCLAEINALEAVYPESSVLLCDFQREKTWTEWLNKHMKKEDCERTKRLLRGVAKAHIKAQFETAVANLKLSLEWINSSSLQRWYTAYWEPCIERWAAVYRSNKLKVAINTNNGVERQNETLKHTYLSGYKQCSLSELLTVVIESYLEREFDKYRNANIESCQEYGKLESSLPYIAHDMPRDVIQHIASKWELIQDPNDVTNEGNGKFTVKSDRLDERYLVNLWVPYCECYSWCQNKLPCKHMCAIFRFYPGSWLEVPEVYRKSPFLTVDYYCITGQSNLLTHEMMQSELEPECAFSGSEEDAPLPAKKRPRKHRLRNRCNEVIKALQDVVFDVSDTDYLKSLEEKLKKILDEAKSVSEAN